jgi:predicted lipoprotein with Yx(FWY)xxD motif
MRTILSVAIAAAIVALGSGVALAQTAEPAKAGESAKGKTLVDAKGMTLYIYDRDTAADKSSCNGNCATNWPPLMASADAKSAGAWTVITRDDGGKQWAYKGKPRRRRPQQRLAYRRALIARFRLPDTDMRPGGRGCAPPPGRFRHGWVVFSRLPRRRRPCQDPARLSLPLARHALSPIR